MTERRPQWGAILVIVLLALPSGLCSLFFTPTGLMMIGERDALAHDIGWLMLGTSAVGWLFCGLMIYLARRLSRRAESREPGRLP